MAVVSPLSDVLQQLVKTVNQTLHTRVSIRSVRPHDPIQVLSVPVPWKLLGTGNYAAVFAHPDYPDYAIKIYAPGRPGLEDEVEVYRRIGEHPAYSQCFYTQDNFLILKRLCGVTLYDCLKLGHYIPPQVVQGVDNALLYATSRGLTPRDVHGKNVMMHGDRGLVVDISDFLGSGVGSAWADFKRFYHWFYQPLLAPMGLRIPGALLDVARQGYRLLRTVLKRQA